MPVLRIGILVLVLGTCGCSPCGCLVKRQSELSCPTDIRQTVPWCVGEDAIFHCPCGPNQSFYGYKPTCWGVWPAPAAEWRDERCGPHMDHYEGDEYLPEELPPLSPGQPEEAAPDTPPARDDAGHQEDAGTLPGLPVPEVSSSGTWPTERITGRVRPATAAYLPTIPATTRLAARTLARPRVEPKREPPFAKAPADRIGDAPMLPDRLIVFQKPDRAKSTPQQSQPPEADFVW